MIALCEENKAASFVWFQFIWEFHFELQMSWIIPIFTSKYPDYKVAMEEIPSYTN
jgi:hypothetical protein